MSSMLTAMGFPPPEKRDAVRFVFAKEMPYQTRITLAGVLAVVGLALQAAFMNFIFGLPFIVIAVSLVLIQGFDSRPKLKHFDLDPTWVNVDLIKVIELEELRKKNLSWDSDGFEASNPKGFWMLVLCCMIGVGVSVILGRLAHSVDVMAILIVDFALIVFPLWLSGMKFILNQPKLNIKVKIVLMLAKAFENARLEGEEFRPGMQMSRDTEGETVPRDLRFTVSFPTKPEGFFGLQGQINLNDVQGTQYPYAYCVIAAEPGFGLQKFTGGMVLPSGIICEFQDDGKAEVLVIRQKTTKTSGYHTDDRRCVQIMLETLRIGREVLASKA